MVEGSGERAAARYKRVAIVVALIFLVFGAIGAFDSWGLGAEGGAGSKVRASGRLPATSGWILPWRLYSWCSGRLSRSTVGVWARSGAKTGRRPAIFRSTSP